MALGLKAGTSTSACNSRALSTNPFFTMPMIYLCFFLQSDQAIPGQTTVLVVVEGLVKYDGHKIHRFSQNFLLTAEGGTVWKVASDCFRFIQ